MLSLIDSCRSKVSTEKYHLTVPQAQVSTHRAYVFFEVVSKLGTECICSVISITREIEITNIFSTINLASHSLLQFVAFWCRSAFIVASDWFVLPI